MRDPLRNVSVRFKLAFTFLGVCLLAFGVGGFLVSRSAREALEREILSQLHFQSQFYATVLEGDLRALGLRARDFASDGYIRNRYAEFLEARHAGREPQEGPLREHLLVNKLPLEDAFSNLALLDTEGRNLFLAEPEDHEWAADLPAAASGEQDWFSGLVTHVDEGGVEAPEPPSVIVSTPLWSLTGDRQLGSLLVRVHAGVWIAGALGSIQAGAERPGTGFRLRLIDHRGHSLEIPSEFMLDPPPARSSPLVLRGAGLRVREATSEPRTSITPTRGLLSRSFPVRLTGWSLETSLDTEEALAPVSGLQARFLFVGLMLTAAACVILFFPMRFLARPIRRLHGAAMDMRGGDFSTRVPVESQDEIGELSHSFNLMAQAVEERTEKLEASARSLEQRRNELAKERDRLNAVIHSMRDGLMVLDADGHPEVWNAAAEPLRAVVRNDGLELSSHRNCRRAAESANGNGNGNGARDANGADDDAADVENPCLRCLIDPTAPARSCLLDVGPFVYEVRSSALAPGPDGRAGRVLVARDVTDRAQQDERQIHQERLAVLGEVAAVMAHELNNPLAAIRMFTQMAADKVQGDAEVREDLTVIERNTETCSRTIRELLDYATGATPEVGPVDVHESLREVASFLRAVRERKETELELALEAADPIVVGDEVQLRQVFVNLVMNAFQAVGEGRVTVRTALDGTHLVVDVIDEGPGIDPDIGDEVFKPFYTTKPRGSGTGLGLPTARRITEIQGGGLTLLDSRPGRTTFRVRLLRGNP